MTSDEIGLDEFEKLKGLIRFDIKQDPPKVNMEIGKPVLKKKLEIIVRNGKQRGNTGTTAKLF
jgi:hypothetical protein